MKFVTTTATAALLAALAMPALADGDAAEGEKVFRKCKACHAVGDGAKNRVGPMLNGVVDNPAGQNPDFKYSSGLQAAAADGLVWDDEALEAFLTKPRDFIDGTKMSFGGLSDEEDIEDVIAYLRTFP
jgi:cytochrome c